MSTIADKVGRGRGHLLAGFREHVGLAQRLGGATALVHVYVDDIEEHCERARAAIRDEPQEKPYGTIQYAAADPEGHLWLFSEQIREPDLEWRIDSSSG